MILDVWGSLKKKKEKKKEAEKKSGNTLGTGPTSVNTNNNKRWKLYKGHDRVFLKLMHGTYTKNLELDTIIWQVLKIGWQLHL